VRNVFVIGPDKKFKLVLVHPMTTGRNFDEVLRVIDSLQLTATYRVATPVNWQQGEDVIIAGSVANDEASRSSAAGQRPSPTFGSCRNPLVMPVHVLVRCEGFGDGPWPPPERFRRSSRWANHAEKE
jgi:hypothetical protein